MAHTRQETLPKLLWTRLYMSMLRLQIIKLHCPVFLFVINKVIKQQRR
jgi:hypothetical protein